MVRTFYVTDYMVGKIQTPNGRSPLQLVLEVTQARMHTRANTHTSAHAHRKHTRARTHTHAHTYILARTYKDIQ